MGVLSYSCVSLWVGLVVVNLFLGGFGRGWWVGLVGVNFLFMFLFGRLRKRF